MSNTATFDKSGLYRADVVETFRQAADTEVKRLTDEAAALQKQVNDLTIQIRDREQQIKQYQQVMSMVTAHEDLPLSPTCRTCGKPILSVNNKWWHAGWEAMQFGYRCNPEDKNSPVAEAAKGTAQAFGDWNGALDEERSGGHS